jgi:hypothetical protein
MTHISRTALKLFALTFKLEIPIPAPEDKGILDNNPFIKED